MTDGFEPNSDRVDIEEIRRTLQDVIDSQIGSNHGNDNSLLDTSLGSRNSASGDATGIRSNEPITHNTTDIDSTNVDTGVYDKINLISSMVVVDDPVNAGDIILRNIQGIVKNGATIKLTPKDGRTLIIEPGGNILVPTTISISDKEIYEIVKYSEAETGIVGGGYKASTWAGNTKIQNLGNLSGIFNVDFDVFDSRQLYGNQVGQDVTLTFSNIPDNLSTNIKIYMTPADVNGSLTIGGNDIFSASTDPFSVKPLVTNDFLSIEIESPDNSTINIISVKKNDDSGGGDVAPGIPGNIYAIGNTSTSVQVSWDQPETGTLPIEYEIAYSTSPAGNSTDGPDTPSAGSPVTGITENLETITGLSAATTYYFWVRGTNTIGDGLYAGPQQTNTEGTTNPGAVNFGVVTINFRSFTINWDQPGTLLFTLFRTDPDGDVVTFQERKTTSGPIVDNYNIDPDTEYTYTLQTYNEFNTQLGTQTIIATSDPLPTPVFVLSVVNGQKLNFNVTFPASITLSEIQWALDSGFTEGVVNRDFSRPIGDWNVPGSFDFTSDELLQGTTYYGRVRFVKETDTGPYAATQNVTTSIEPVPDELDDFNNLNIAGDANGLIRLEVNFGNSSSIGESAIITFRDAASVGGYFTYPGFELSRDNPPTDDLDPGDEDEIQVVRGGGGHGAVGTLTVVAGAVTNIAVTFGGKEYKSGEQIRIYDDNDSNYVDFTGTAVVNSLGQLTAVNIINGGDFFDNGSSVLLVGFVNEAGTEAAPWGIGNSLTGRAVAKNETGSSDPEFDTMSVGS